MGAASTGFALPGVLFWEAQPAKSPTNKSNAHRQKTGMNGIENLRGIKDRLAVTFSLRRPGLPAQLALVATRKHRGKGADAVANPLIITGFEQAPVVAIVKLDGLFFERERLFFNQNIVLHELQFVRLVPKCGPAS